MLENIRSLTGFEVISLHFIAFEKIKEMLITTPIYGLITNSLVVLFYFILEKQCLSLFAFPQLLKWERRGIENQSQPFEVEIRVCVTKQKHIGFSLLY